MNGFDFEPSELYNTVKHLQNNGCAFQYFEDTELQRTNDNSK